MPDLKMAEAATKPAGTQVLSVQDLQAWYGESHILHGVNFNVNAGEVVTLLGRNGAGKTTTLKSVMGIIAKRTGSVRFNNQEIIRTASDKIARQGIGYDHEVIIAHHDTIIEPEDHVIVFVVNKRMVPEVEKLFQVDVGFV